jgi:hypothetical protein
MKANRRKQTKENHLNLLLLKIARPSKKTSMHPIYLFPCKLNLASSQIHMSFWRTVTAYLSDFTALDPVLRGSGHTRKNKGKMFPKP